MYNFGASNDPLVSNDLSSWFSKVFSGFRRSWQALLIYQLIGLVPSVVVSVTVLSQFKVTTGANGQPTFGDGNTVGGGFFVGILAFIALSVVISGVTTVASSYVIAHDAAASGTESGGRADWKMGIRFGLSKLGRSIAWSLAAGLLIGVGTLLCVLPGIYVGVVMFSSLTGVIAFERGTVVGRCFEQIGRASCRERVLMPV